jgi:predicted Rossmann fold nucleotide-binding protein DprA/Smf involved in DNA uptake
VDNARATLLRDFSYDPVDIDDLISWCAQPASIVWTTILELGVAGLVTQH